MRIFDAVRSGAQRSIRRANFARDRGLWAEAARHYRLAVECNPSLGHIWEQLAHALKEQGELISATQAYERAIAVLPQATETHIHLAYLLKRLGRYEGATSHLLSALHAGLHAPQEEKELFNLMMLQAEVDRQRLHENLKRRLHELGNSPSDSAFVNKLRRIMTDPVDTSAGAIQTCGGAALVFDVSDLISYFKNARLPTGIQRVQIETIEGALLSDESRVVLLCCFAEGREDWLEIPLALMREMSRLAKSGGNSDDPEWVEALNELRLHLSLTIPFEFPDRAYLINLGTSWWLQNYFLFVRQAKAKYGIRYVPFVHDLIPILASEHCTRPLTQDFISWVSAVFDHADHFLVNSRATRDDLMQVAKMLGRELSATDVAVIRLDADFRKAAVADLPESTLERWSLKSREFVLFVSTIESRKGHLTAFDAWSKLIFKHGPDKVPQLVCVGNRGWLNDEIYHRLDSDSFLSQRVTMLSQLSDAELALLYKSCRFTLYPSLYEGWGLPVTESLCYGKVPLISDAASLPEAGGDFAVYFKSGSTFDLIERAQALIFDDRHLFSLERKILAEFRPRSWSALASQIVDELDQFVERDLSAKVVRGLELPLATLGQWASLSRNASTRIWNGMRSGEAFRSNLGWYWPEDRGCRIRQIGGELRMRFDRGHGELRIFIQLHGDENEHCEWIIQCQDQARQGRLERSDQSWICFDIDAEPSPHELRLVFKACRVGTTHPTYFVRGFYIYDINDIDGRLAFLEKVALGCLESIEPAFPAIARLKAGMPDRDDQFLHPQQPFALSGQTIDIAEIANPSAHSSRPENSAD